MIRRLLHPSAGAPLPRRDEVDDVLRAQCAAHEVLAEDAAGRAGLGDVKPVRHLRSVHPYDWQSEFDEDAE